MSKWLTTARTPSLATSSSFAIAKHGYYSGRDVINVFRMGVSNPCKATQIKLIVSQAVEMKKVMRDAHFYFILQATPTNLISPEKVSKWVAEYSSGIETILTILVETSIFSTRCMPDAERKLPAAKKNELELTTRMSRDALNDVIINIKFNVDAHKIDAGGPEKQWILFAWPNQPIT